MRVPVEGEFFYTRHRPSGSNYNYKLILVCHFLGTPDRVSVKVNLGVTKVSTANAGGQWRREELVL